MNMHLLDCLGTCWCILYYIQKGYSRVLFVEYLFFPFRFRWVRSVLQDRSSIRNTCQEHARSKRTNEQLSTARSDTRWRRQRQRPDSYKAKPSRAYTSTSWSCSITAFTLYPHKILLAIFYSSNLKFIKLAIEISASVVIKLSLSEYKKKISFRHVL